ncbi:hypothetical protein ANOM_003152 [Aspergillus nomiae NRRL 13137]|uniref:F-box domain-containing protein n=1 Tax=Aspergillus nomiae NRRL (strain ATCC 15546 / NRRL 13137 / CBS 260.88 / M93) TaxID=1509407 RepID=A0A0L1JCG8_ASPN3|nr:uncharacterized protein ANOM_003152 [Aspergillus nomiae NRRL 13137]KNG89424.1 hypothetical protein ANOM_003152 [Aspergillus nomiae NRRL 13137]
MASGTAYRCEKPCRETLDYYLSPDDSKPAVMLYKAPPHKKSRINPKYTPLFDRLPLEIVHLILLNLDLPSLGRLRRVSTRGRCLVESLPAYSLLRALASDTLRMMDITKCASYFPIGRLFTEFCHPWCRTCTDLGPFIYFPTLTRSCYKCSYLRPEYEVAPMRDICLKFALTLADIHQSKLPIIYHPEKPPHHLMDVARAKAVGIKLHGSKKAMERAYQTRRKEYERDYQRRVQEWQKRRHQGTHTGGRPRRRWNPTPLVEKEDEPSWRLQASVAFPYWDSRTRTLEPGTYCRACTYHWEEGNADDWRRMETIFHLHPPSREAYYRAFLEADLPQHFLNCVAMKQNYNFRVERLSLTERLFKRKGTDFIVGPKNTTDA